MTAYKSDFFVTPECRFAYAYLDEPRTEDLNGKKLDEPKYEAVLYFPKTNPDPRLCSTYQLLMRYLTDGMQRLWSGQWPKPNYKDWPIHDCDADFQELEKNPHGRGMWRIRASAGKYPPDVADPNNNKMEKDVRGRFRYFKGGDWGYASINVFSYDNTFGKGLSFGLEGVKKTRDGDSIGGGGRSIEQIWGPSTGPAVGGGGPAPALPPGMSGYGALTTPQQQPYAPPGAPAPYAGQPPQQQPYAGQPPQQQPSYPAAAPQGVYGGAPPQPAFAGPASGYPAPAGPGSVYPAAPPVQQGFAPPGAPTAAYPDPRQQQAAMPPQPPQFGQR
jgi:hypothetical protein